MFKNFPARGLQAASVCKQDMNERFDLWTLNGEAA
jgi:hypothetical protein